MYTARFNPEDCSVDRRVVFTFLPAARVWWVINRCRAVCNCLRLRLFLDVNPLCLNAWSSSFTLMCWIQFLLPWPVWSNELFPSDNCIASIAGRDQCQTSTEVAVVFVGWFVRCCFEKWLWGCGHGFDHSSPWQNPGTKCKVLGVELTLYPHPRMREKWLQNRRKGCSLKPMTLVMNKV